MVSRRPDGRSVAQEVKVVVGGAHDHVRRSLDSINHSLGTIQRTRDRILSGHAAAFEIQARYEHQLQDALVNTPPDVIRRMIVIERMTAATAISADLVDLGLQLVETSRRRLLSA